MALTCFCLLHVSLLYFAIVLAIERILTRIGLYYVNRRLVTQRQKSSYLRRSKAKQHSDSGGCAYASELYAALRVFFPLHSSPTRVIDDRLSRTARRTRSLKRVEVRHVLRDPTTCYPTKALVSGLPLAASS
ncbi:hypothetical protein C8Q73DRAFT_384618 [Cubamyces lactineus]|nr:hypothetical protein C8Q73DRAFT_384618 [Cubamyces lactineus]